MLTPGIVDVKPFTVPSAPEIVLLTVPNPPLGLRIILTGSPIIS